MKSIARALMAESRGSPPQMYKSRHLPRSLSETLKHHIYILPNTLPTLSFVLVTTCIHGFRGISTDKMFLRRVIGKCDCDGRVVGCSAFPDPTAQLPCLKKSHMRIPMPHWSRYGQETSSEVLCLDTQKRYGQISSRTLPGSSTVTADVKLQAANKTACASVYPRFSFTEQPSASPWCTGQDTRTERTEISLINDVGTYFVYSRFCQASRICTSLHTQRQLGKTFRKTSDQVNGNFAKFLAANTVRQTAQIADKSRAFQLCFDLTSQETDSLSVSQSRL